MTPGNAQRRSTHWSVITGAPCSGKTAVIHMLEQQGYTVIHEVARAYIDSDGKSQD
ncbi:MAG: AAA family ATPase [Desulfobacterales bacterium]